MDITAYQPEHFEGVKALWAEAFPDEPDRNRAELVIPAKLGVQPELFLVALEKDCVIGTTMAGFDGHRGWLHKVAVAQSHRGQGIGRLLVKRAEELLQGLGCTKINLQVRSTNRAVIAFYDALGFAVEDRISMGKRV